MPLQYARTLGEEPLPPGRAVVNTVEPNQVQRLVELLEGMGFLVQAPRPVTWQRFLAENPLVVMMGIFWTMACGCIGLFLWLDLGERRPELALRARFGALAADLFWENRLGGMPGAGLGCGLGVGAGATWVVAMGSAPWFFPGVVIGTVAAMVAFLTTMAGWAVVLFLRLRTLRVSPLA